MVPKYALQKLGLFPITRALYRSLYPPIRAQRSKELAFYKEILLPNSLCFDIGANLGQRSDIFLACGARTIIVEPNVQCMPTLTFHFARNPKASILPNAVGRECGHIDLYVHGTDSTASVVESWDRTIYGSGIHKTTAVTVPITTLDVLINRFGTPNYIKIDVEGYEFAVLSGLSRSVPLISFEFDPKDLTSLHLCLEKLATLGRIVAMRTIDMKCNWTSERTNDIEKCLRTVNIAGDMFVWMAQ